MKKILSVCAVMLAVLALLVSCGGKSPCSDHKDDNADGVCDICEAQVEVTCDDHVDDGDGKCDICGSDVKKPAVMVDYTLTVKDQDGALIEGAELTVYAGFDETAKATTDENGKVSGKLAEGQYTVSFDYLPDGYAAYELSTLITVSKDHAEIEIIVENITPNGSAERPFPVSLEAPSVTLPANTGYYFAIGGGTRLMKIEATNLEIIYGDKTYTPDENGMIEIKLIPQSNFSPTVIKFINKADSEKVFAMTFESLPGSPERPYEALIDTSYTASIDKEQTVYYQWIADKSGILAIVSDTEHNTMMLYNKTTMSVSSYTDGDRCEYVFVNVGDEISIAVASTSTDDVSEVAFILKLFSASTTDPVILYKDSTAFSFAPGAEYSFACEANNGVFSVKSSSITVKINGELIEADENGKVEISVNSDDIITVKNVSESRHEAFLKITASVEDTETTPEE